MMRLLRLVLLMCCVATSLAATSGDNAGTAQNEAADQKAEPAAKQVDPANAEPKKALAVPPLSDVKFPYELVRTLEKIQNRMTTGNIQAHIIQRAVIADIAQRFAKTPDGLWQEPRNARAAITYVLSGGDPHILHQLLKFGQLSGGVTNELLRGLIAYSRDRNNDAFELIGNIPAQSLGRTAGGHLALAQATVAVHTPAKVLAFLDQARLLAPGTLVEEAALRRKVALTVKLEDFDKFLPTVSDYLWRFPKSTYAHDFHKTFATGVATTRFAENIEYLKRLTDTLDVFSVETRKSSYLALSEAGLMNGHIGLTRLAANKLLEVARDDPPLALRAQLLDAAALVVTDEYDRALATLKAIDATKLSPRDRDLRSAVLTLAARLREPPASPSPDEPPASAAQGKDGGMQDVPDAIKAGRRSIAIADELLSGANQ